MKKQIIKIKVPLKDLQDNVGDALADICKIIGYFDKRNQKAFKIYFDYALGKKILSCLEDFLLKVDNDLNLGKDPFEDIHIVL